MLFFLSSRRRHTRCALVTGVQTCALPIFFIFSALAGQLADSRDKTWMIRLIKTAEIGIMVVGGVGIWLHNVPLMLLALFSMGMHSTFFEIGRASCRERVCQYV